ncbi:9555_t:CDS:1 [Funneliformis caledonium]|uniref:9555_t:CDS:1 n=1 Tax=Funneliformis caledonium TaxID=1117310 RepID=A0A9N9GJU7_9GLOM|nr:9555_t:CDS:1 [Funneliformis caledonium]
MEFLKDSSKNPQINLSHKNNTLPRLVRTGRNFYLSPEYSKIFEQHNVKYQYPLPLKQNLFALNYYLQQNESGFSQNFPAANYFGVERGSGALQRYKIYQEENGANFKQTPDTEVNH